MLKNDVNDVKSLINEINQYESEIKNIDKDLKIDYKSMTQQVTKIDIWIKEDYQRVFRCKYRF